MPDPGDYHGYRAGTSAWKDADQDETIAGLPAGAADPEAPAWSAWITLTNADILGLFTTPKEVLAAPGVGKWYRYHAAQAITDCRGGAYTNVDAQAQLRLEFGNAGAPFAALPADTHDLLTDGSGGPWINYLVGTEQVDGAGPTFKNAFTFYAFADVENLPITARLSNGATNADVEDGHADNTIKVRVLRSVLSLPS